MAAFVWPAGLPQVPRPGFGEVFGENRILTAMDAAEPKVRRRFTKRIDGLDIPLRLTEAQVATLDTFYTSTLSDGSARFDFPHPREVGSTVECIFARPPSITHVETGADGTPFYDVSLALQIVGVP